MTWLELIAADEFFEWKGDKSDLIAQIVCQDGFKLSIQASKAHYCTPKSNTGPYSELEIKLYKDKDAPTSWREYRGGDGIYGYVPVEKIEELISEHSGESHLQKCSDNYHQEFLKNDEAEEEFYLNPCESAGCDHRSGEHKNCGQQERLRCPSCKEILYDTASL